MDRLQGALFLVTLGTWGREGEELIPMNMYPSLACDRHDPWPGTPGGSGMSPHSSRCFPSQGEGPADTAERSAELDECQEESHSEPRAVLTCPPPHLCSIPGAGLAPLPCTGPSHLCVWRTRTWPSPRRREGQLPALGQGTGSLPRTHSVPATQPGPSPKLPRLTLPTIL